MTRFFRLAAWLMPAGALLLALPGCEPAKPTLAQVPPATVTVARPLKSPVQDFTEFPGRVEAKEKVEVRARVTGYLDSINFKEGGLVEKDQVLFQIDPRPYQASLDQAKADVERWKAQIKLAEVELGRAEQLLRRNAGTRQDLDKAVASRDEAKAALAAAEAKVRQTDLDLNFTRIIAPVAGQISRTNVTVGNLVAADSQGQPLTTIVSTDPMYVYFEPDEASLLRYQARTKEKYDVAQRPQLDQARLPLFIGLANETGFPRQGTIDFGDNQVDPGTGTIRVRGVFANPKLDLIPGMFARVQLPEGEPYEALLVPDRAVNNDQGKKFVWVVDDKGQVARKDVVLGREEKGLRVVKQGLAAEDRVIINGAMRVREGDKVEVQDGQIQPLQGAPREVEAPPTATAAPAAAEPAASAPAANTTTTESR